jgi:predicted PhzF superfamily epimerase YddE/YHI9
MTGRIAEEDAILNSGRSFRPEFDFVSRFFAPGAGIGEDPVTGSAHCCLAAYWRKRLSKDTFMACQASTRGGVVQLRISGDRAILGGQRNGILLDSPRTMP